MNTDKFGFSRLLLRHEAILLFVLTLEWLCFTSVGPRFGTPDNTFDIVRHSVEIGLLALVMTPIILTGGIDLSVGSLLGLCAIYSANCGAMPACPFHLRWPARSALELLRAGSTHC